MTKHATDSKTIRDDARGQFATSKADRTNDGVISAIPTDVAGHDDATLDKAGRKPSPKPGFDDTAPDRSGD